MWFIKNKNYCRKLKVLMLKLLADRFGIDRNWVQNHIANCPRCQRRIMRLGKVELALSLLKSQPHNLDLLMRANTQAIGVLKHSLRTAPKAELLRSIRPEPGIFERCARYKHPLANAAACIAVAVLMNSSAFSSAKTFEDKSRKAVENYYVKQLGKNVASEIFSSNA